MQITKIKVNGFKSLVDFEMDISKFTCLIGLNGSGKSTVLQFIDFLSQLVRGNMATWLEERHWEAHDVGSHLLPKTHIVEFTVNLKDKNENPVVWEARYNINEKKCTYESIEAGPSILAIDKPLAPILKMESQKLDIWRPDIPREEVHGVHGEKILIKYQGSAVSAILDEYLPHGLLEFRAFFQNVKSFDMLAPQSLRMSNRESGGSIGLSGQWLSAFIHELGPKKQQELTDKLQKVYPQLKNIFTRSLQSGWKRLEIREKYSDREFNTASRHINDGLLRLLAILAELESRHQFLLFDEIENGINPELVEFVVDVLTNSDRQIMVTTHSPMILNYLYDDTARESVIYLYKREDGRTNAIKFFDIPSQSRKLTVMGPGEVFVDTDLPQLVDEIASLSEVK